MTDELNLQAKADEMEAALRGIGVYFDSAAWQDPKAMMKAAAEAADDDEMREHAENAKTPFILAVDAFVGDVAFTSRVQNPEQHSMDDEFRSIAQEFKDQEFQETRTKILQALKEGRNPFESTEGESEGD